MKQQRTILVNISQKKRNINTYVYANAPILSANNI